MNTTANNTHPLLEIRNLSVDFRTDDGVARAVSDVSLTISQGEVLGLVGESGCGKSVTAMSILRLIPSPPGIVKSGSIRFHEHDLLHMPIADLRCIRGRAISVIFQEPMDALSPLHRVGDQLVEALRFHTRQSRAAAAREACEWLTRVGIPAPAERMQAYPHELSGGMRQRVMIAMAMMLHPELLIADEPTTALDVTIQAQIFELIRAMRGARTSVLLITHDMGVVWEMCTRVAVMYASELVEIGSTDEIFTQPRHPYTRALLESIPSNTAPGAVLPVIAGQVPSALNYPTGCHFRERCRYAFERCAREHPAFYRHGERMCRCFLAEENP
jgi:oligopeptide/dipeptide ABC transporter ATP-binding protein